MSDYPKAGNSVVFGCVCVYIAPHHNRPKSLLLADIMTPRWKGNLAK